MSAALAAAAATTTATTTSVLMIKYNVSSALLPYALRNPMFIDHELMVWLAIEICNYYCTPLLSRCEYGRRGRGRERNSSIIEKKHHGANWDYW